MSSINLLPWRETARKSQQLDYLATLALVAVLTFILMFLVYGWYQVRIEGQIKRNLLLEAEIKKLEQRLVSISELEKQKVEVQQRIAVVEQLQLSRNEGTRLMNEIARTVPVGVYLISVEKKHNHVLITGKAESTNRVSEMLRGIELSSLLTTPVLEFIQAGKEQEGALSDFRMQISLVGHDTQTLSADAARKIKRASEAGQQGGAL